MTDQIYRESIGKGSAFGVYLIVGVDRSCKSSFDGLNRANGSSTSQGLIDVERQSTGGHWHKMEKFECDEQMKLSMQAEASI